MENPIFQPKSAQQAQPRARARAPSAPDRRTPHVGASPRAPSLPLSISLLCGAGLSVPFSSRTCSSSLDPADPTRQPTPNLKPTPPPWTCPRPRNPWPPPHALAPLEPTPRSPTSPCSFVPSAEHSHPLSRPTRTPRQFRRCSSTSTARSTVTVELPAAYVASISSALSPATWNAPRFPPTPLVHPIHAH
jgi:hypothetical protein